MTLPVFLQQIVNGLTVGSLFALVAIGYTLVFGIIRLINFAHGDVFMVAMYVAYYAITAFNITWYWALLLTVLFVAAFGILIDRAAYKPLRQQNAPTTTMMISAIGVSYLLQNAATVLFTGRQKQYPQISYFTEVIKIGSVSFQRMAIIVPIITIILLIALTLFTNKTKVGMAMRAVSSDMETVYLMGIDVNNIVTLAFGIGSALAAIGAVFWGTKYISIAPLAGSMPGLKSFICAVIGGIGNINGAFIGGYFLGLLETMIVAFFPQLTSYKDAISFVCLILILLIRPTGLISEKIIKKV